MDAVLVAAHRLHRSCPRIHPCALSMGDSKEGGEAGGGGSKSKEQGRLATRLARRAACVCVCVCVWQLLHSPSSSSSSDTESKELLNCTAKYTSCPRCGVPSIDACRYLAAQEGGWRGWNAGGGRRQVRAGGASAVEVEGEQAQHLGDKGAATRIGSLAPPTHHTAPYLTPSKSS